MGGIFFRGKDTEFQFCLKQSFFSVSTEKVTPSAGFTEKSGIFWLPPRHNKQRDPHKRSDSCYMGPYQAFKQKTSPLDTPFSRKASSKLLTFQWIFKEKDCSPLRPSTWKNKLPLKNSPFSIDSEELCLGQNCQAVSSNKKVFHRIGNSIHSGLAEFGLKCESVTLAVFSTIEKPCAARLVLLKYNDLETCSTKMRISCC